MRLTIDNELFDSLEQSGALGLAGPDGSRGDIRWEQLLDHLRDKLQLSTFNLKVGLHQAKQDRMTARDFAREFKQRAKDAEISKEVAKTALIAALNKDTLQKLDGYIAMKAGGDLATLESTA